MIPAVHTRHVCCVYVYNMHVLVWFFETLVVIWLAVFYAPSGPYARDCQVHTLLYDRARPRLRLSDRAGVCLCKGYDSIDNMVEATCLWVWDFTTHNHLDL